MAAKQIFRAGPGLTAAELGATRSTRRPIAVLSCGAPTNHIDVCRPHG